jgi:DHA2 family multidrug resistance protein-like MFS transporter
MIAIKVDASASFLFSIDTPGQSAYAASRVVLTKLSFALTQTPSPQDGLPHPQRTWALVTVGLAIVMTLIDQTIVNVALPTMSAELNVDASSSVWIVNAYQVAIMLALLPLSSAGDI